MSNECGIEVACLTVLEEGQMILGLTRAFRGLVVALAYLILAPVKVR